MLTLFQEANQAKIFTFGGIPTFQINLGCANIGSNDELINKWKKDLLENIPDFSPTQILESLSNLEIWEWEIKSNNSKNSPISLSFKLLGNYKSHEKKSREFKRIIDAIKVFVLHEILYKRG